MGPLETLFRARRGTQNNRKFKVKQVRILPYNRQLIYLRNHLPHMYICPSLTPETSRAPISTAHTDPPRGTCRLIVSGQPPKKVHDDGTHACMLELGFFGESNPSAAATCGLLDLALFSSRCGSLPPLGGAQNCTASRKGRPLEGPPAPKPQKTTVKNNRPHWFGIPGSLQG